MHPKNYDPATGGTMIGVDVGAFEPVSGSITCGQHTGGGALDANGEFTDLVASACSANQAVLTCRDSTAQTLNVGGIQRCLYE
jgi:hypothetical protein